MKVSELSEKLMEKGLKVTPQRMAVLEAFGKLGNHPTAENIITSIRKSHPNVATATVYKVLETLVESGLINKVKTDRDIMRYDPIMERHHHLYSTESDRIEDYMDEDLNKLIQQHFKKKEIPGFVIEDVKLQIIGRFK